MNGSCIHHEVTSTEHHTEWLNDHLIVISLVKYCDCNLNIDSFVM